MAEKKTMKEKADKRRRAKIKVGANPDGTPIIKYASGRTKQEMEDNKAELKRIYREGLQDVQADVMFGAYVWEWYETYKRPHIGEGSHRAYKSAMDNYILPAFENRQLRTIKPIELQKLLNSVSDKGRATVGYINSVIQRVFERAMVDRIISYNPTIALTAAHADAATKRALTPEEEAAALYVARTHPWGLLLYVLYYTGVRRGEALGLKWSDFDFAKNTVRIERDIDYNIRDEGDLKTTSSERTIPVADELLKALLPLREIGTGYVFHVDGDHNAFYPETTFRYRWERLQVAMLEHSPKIAKKELPSSRADRKKAEKHDEDIPPERYGSILTPHYFRHNFASICYNAGIDVMTAHKWLGHKDPKTTLAIYTHLSAEKEQQGTEALNAAFSKKVAKRLPEADLKNN